MSSQSRKSRGYETQRLVAAALAADLFPYATDAGAGRQGRDVLNTPGLSIEVKARAGFDPLAWIRQARTNTAEGEVAAVTFRPNGMGPAQLPEWPVLLRFEDFVELLRKAGYGNR